MKHKCILKTSIWKVFEIFADEPLKIHFIKEISRKINLAPTSVRKHIRDLKEENIIFKKKGERFYGYVSNRNDDNFLFYKKILNLVKIKESGLIENLIKALYPKTIVLYGSYYRGEDVENSDIDLLIISNKKKEFNLEKFEKLLKRRIHIISEENLNRLDKNLRLEIINGIVLYGYLKNG
jgi:predicted nucleotidyltransferase